MKTIPILLLLCIPSHAALPPSPIARPAPLQSPRAASQPKYTPMLKAEAVVRSSSTEPSTVFIDVLYNININHCDTNDPNCLVWDQTHVWAVQKAGYHMTIEYTDRLGSGEWAWISQTGAAPYDRVENVYRFLPKWQRPMAEAFRTVSVLVPTGSLTAAGGRRLNPQAEANGWFFKPPN